MKTTYKTKIYSLAFGGDGIGKIDGKVCFVEGALPGEEILFDVIKEKKNYIKGSVVKILTSSPNRINPECQYYNLCGGCQYQHLSYEKELYHKQNQVIELIQKIAGTKNFKCEGIEPSDNHYNYRSSITLHKKSKNKIHYLGYYAKDNKTILQINNCAIANKNIIDTLSKIKLKQIPDNITLKTDYNGNVWK